MLRSAPPETSARQPLWLLRPADQCIVAGLVVVALTGLAAAWFAYGGARGELVEFNRLQRGGIRFQVDINQADWTELSELPRIGPTLAQRIVEHRESYGPFCNAEDLQRVRGIGVQTLREIRPYLAPVSDNATKQPINQPPAALPAPDGRR